MLTLQMRQWAVECWLPGARRSFRSRRREGVPDARAWGQRPATRQGWRACCVRWARSS